MKGEVKNRENPALTVELGGAVQQHLEPNHVSDILIPIPANWADADQLIENVRNQLLLKEALEDATSNLDKDVCVLISGLIDKARQKNA